MIDNDGVAAERRIVQCGAQEESEEKGQLSDCRARTKLILLRNNNASIVACTIMQISVV